MAFHLQYEEGGKERRKQFSSYYECIKEKEKLRKRGIECSYGESGMDVTQHYGTTRIGTSEKQAISRFLKMCNDMGDYVNAKKSVVK